MAEFKKDEAEIGSLWLKTGARGEFLSGDIDGVQVVCFKVNSDNPRAPTYRVLRSRPRDTAPPQERVSTPRLPINREPTVEDDEPF